MQLLDARIGAENKLFMVDVFLDAFTRRLIKLDGVNRFVKQISCFLFVLILVELVLATVIQLQKKSNDQTSINLNKKSSTAAIPCRNFVHTTESE